MFRVDGSAPGAFAYRPAVDEGRLLRVAMAIHHAAFDPQDAAQAKRQVPSPGWCWEKASQQHRDFAMRQAAAAIAAYVGDEA